MLAHINYCALSVLSINLVEFYVGSGAHGAFVTVMERNEVLL